MSNREHNWAWLHPNAQEGDRMKMAGQGWAIVTRREEKIFQGREYVRFLNCAGRRKISLTAMDVLGT